MEKFNRGLITTGVHYNDCVICDEHVDRVILRRQIGVWRDRS